MDRVADELQKLEPKAASASGPMQGLVAGALVAAQDPAIPEGIFRKEFPILPLPVFHSSRVTADGVMIPGMGPNGSWDCNRQGHGELIIAPFDVSCNMYYAYQSQSSSSSHEQSSMHIGFFLNMGKDQASFHLACGVQSESLDQHARLLKDLTVNGNHLLSSTTECLTCGLKSGVGPMDFVKEVQVAFQRIVNARITLGREAPKDRVLEAAGFPHFQALPGPAPALLPPGQAARGHGGAAPQMSGRAGARAPATQGRAVGAPSQSAARSSHAPPPRHLSSSAGSSATPGAARSPAYDGYAAATPTAAVRRDPASGQSGSPRGSSSAQTPAPTAHSTHDRGLQSPLLESYRRELTTLFGAAAAVPEQTDLILALLMQHLPGITGGGPAVDPASPQYEDALDRVRVEYALQQSLRDA